MDTSNKIILSSEKEITSDKNGENVVARQSQVNPKAEATTQAVVEPLFSNGIVAGVVTCATTFGGWAGGFLGREAGLELGKELRGDAERRIIATVNKTAEQLLEDYHIGNNMTKKIIENEVDRVVRREIGDKIEDACIEQGTQKGAVMGSVLAGGATILFMAGINYCHGRYKQYSEEQSKARAEAVNAKNRAARMTDDEVIGDFVVIENNKESANNSLKI